MCLGKNKEKNTFETYNLRNRSLKNNKEEVILVLTIDNKLSFDCRIKKICGTVSKNFVRYQEYQIFCSFL